jgi:hypothetical protein
MIFEHLALMVPLLVLGRLLSPPIAGAGEEDLRVQAVPGPGDGGS